MKNYILTTVSFKTIARQWFIDNVRRTGIQERTIYFMQLHELCELNETKLNAPSFSIKQCKFDAPWYETAVNVSHLQAIQWYTKLHLFLLSRTQADMILESHKYAHPTIGEPYRAHPTIGEPCSFQSPLAACSIKNAVQTCCLDIQSSTWRCTRWPRPSCPYW